MVKYNYRKYLLLLLTILIFIMVLELSYKIKYSSIEEISDIDLLSSSERYGNASDNLILSYEPIANYSRDIYDINSQGLRDYDYSVQKPNDTFRAIVFGDSVTFGYGVLLEDIYSTKLEQYLRENYSDDVYDSFEVINFGVDGYNTLQESELLKHKAINYDPDLIIIGFVLNDWDTPWIIPFIPEKLIEREDLIDSFLPKKCARRTNLRRTLEKSWFVKESSLMNIIFDATIFSYKKHSYNNAFKDPCRFGKIEYALEQFRLIGEEYDVPILLVLFPVKYFDLPYPYLPLHEQMVNIGSEKGFYVLDLQESFFEKNHELFLPHDSGHPDEEGHALAAKEMYDLILSENIIS